MKRITMAALAVAILAIFSATAAAQSVDFNVTVVGATAKGAPNDHVVTFDAPVNLPDATLSAGTYVFRLLTDSVIAVTSIDGLEQDAVFFTSPVTRPEPTGAYEIVVKARGLLSAPRITKMFFPNRTVGFSPSMALTWVVPIVNDTLSRAHAEIKRCDTPRRMSFSTI